MLREIAKIGYFRFNIIDKNKEKAKYNNLIKFCDSFELECSLEMTDDLDYVFHIYKRVANIYEATVKSTANPNNSIQTYWSITDIPKLKKYLNKLIESEK